MTWTDTQITLARTLSAYERAEFASQLMGDKIEGQWRKADALHNDLLKQALAGGYEPAGFHRHLSTVEYCRQITAAFARVLSPYVKESGQ